MEGLRKTESMAPCLRFLTVTDDVAVLGSFADVSRRPASNPQLYQKKTLGQLYRRGFHSQENRGGRLETVFRQALEEFEGLFH